jgi:hypothetical protein
MTRGESVSAHLENRTDIQCPVQSTSDEPTLDSDETLQAEPTPELKQPQIQASGLEARLILRVPGPEDWKEWFSREAHGIDPSERDFLLNTAAEPDGGYQLSIELPSRYSPSDVANANNVRQRAWELSGLWFMDQGRLYDAINVFLALYTHMLKFEAEAERQTHKGMPLVWISECFFRLNYPVHAKRYLMYTLCEDAVAYGREKRAKGSGVYFRAVRGHGMSDQLVTEFTRMAYDRAQELGRDGWFPERLLAELNDDRWMTESPSEREVGSYWSNPLYVEHLRNQLGLSSGRALERLAHYLLSMIPGCRAYRRQDTPSSDYDVVGSFEGPGLDFRSEVGRYFVCECKDWKVPADFTTMAKLARVLDSVKSRFGILFSKNGISGVERTEDAAREQLKVFADRGVTIVVVSDDDIKRIASGESFLALLRSKYEHVRLDIVERAETRIPVTGSRNAKTKKTPRKGSRNTTTKKTPRK